MIITVAESCYKFVKRNVFHSIKSINNSIEFIILMLKNCNQSSYFLGERVTAIFRKHDTLNFRVLIPGGANWYNESGYGQAGEILLDIAIQFNEAGDRFPVWGTCLGFELLIYLYSNKIDPRERCDAWDRADPLDFETGALQSRMFSPAPDSVLNILAYQQVTSNFHRWCVTKEGLTNAGLDSSLQVLATSVDTNGLRYISAFESRTMPIYGVQFHPEKPLYEWNTKEESIPHSAAAIYVSNYFAEFFINEARQSSHTFSNSTEERNSLIYNFSPTYTGAENLIYEQCYFFN